MCLYHLTAECSVGTYWEDGRCVLCPVGTYQDFTGQMSCKECRAGLTTFYVAANSSSDCTECMFSIYKNNF